MIAKFQQPKTLQDMSLFLKDLLVQKNFGQSSSNNLVFDSFIECGNLEKVHCKSCFEYDLVLKPDTNTKRHTHWFMFKVTNKSPVSVKFNILNFMKRKSLLKKGMKPVVFSEKSGWSEVDGVEYSKTQISSNKYYKVSFKFDFKAENDVSTFSLTKPYGFTKLLTLLKEIEEVPELASKMKIRKNNLYYNRKVLCESLGGFPIYLITISGGKEGKGSCKRKSAIFTGRVHPVETVASFVMESFLKFLLSSNSQAIALRKSFVFKIIPMLNPDGVICGNSRTSLSGDDLNRI